MIKLLHFIALFVSVLAKNEEYIGYRVYNVNLTTETQQASFHRLKNDVVDFWRKPCAKYKVVGKAMVPPSHVDWFEANLGQMNVEKDIFIDDVHAYLSQIEELTAESYDGRNSSGEENILGFDYERYYRYDVIVNHLNSVQEKYINSTKTVKVIEYGTTEEKRPLLYLKLTNGNETDKPVVLIEAGIIPRDWVTVPSALNVVDRLLENDARFLDEAVWIVVPVLNPDGYEYTHTNLRLWTKSRSIRSNLGHLCPGVNLDRNFDFNWLVSDSSSSPCSHIYVGTDPASEIETRMITFLIEEYHPRLYISMQNSGKFVTFPWRFEKAASGLFRRHLLKGLDIIGSQDGFVLDSGAIATGDRESGTSTDYARYSRVFYTFNLGVDSDDVLVPEGDIRRVADDVWRAVEVAARDLGL